MLRLAFALFLEITLFVVLLSLYIHGWKIYILSLERRPHARRVYLASLAKRTRTRAHIRLRARSIHLAYISSLSSLSLVLSASASPPRVRYPALPPATHASPGMRESTSELPSLRRFPRDSLANCSLARLLQVVSRHADSR